MIPQQTVILGQCECGSDEGLSKHIPAQSGNGWITLKNPMCVNCRNKKQAELQKVWDRTMRKIARSR